MPLAPAGLLHPLLALLLAPLLPGIVARVKALLAGRRGPPLFQAYRDLRRLFAKGAVYGRSTTWVVRAGPLVALAATVAALLLVPLGSQPAAVAFGGDLVLLAYLLGLARFALVAAALDTGSSFEGMGASREVMVSALAEPALFLGLAALAAATHAVSLSRILAALPASAVVPRLLVGAALGVVFLAENARLPVDDPETHLELTMIHEVMVLDHGGPDLALVQLGAALKLWLLGVLVVQVAVPLASGHLWLCLAALAALAAAVGVLESVTARLGLARVPQLLVAASALGAVALLLVLA